MRSTAATLVLLTSPLVAQTFSHSPASAATADVNSENSFGLSGSSGRYLQTHGDLVGPARTFTELSFRRDGFLGLTPSATARTLDVELFCMHTTAGRPATLFTANYATTPVQVIARKSISLPDLTANLGNPAPWNVVLPFDVPFAYPAASRSAGSCACTARRRAAPSQTLRGVL